MLLRKREQIASAMEVAVRKNGDADEYDTLMVESTQGHGMTEGKRGRRK